MELELRRAHWSRTALRAAAPRPAKPVLEQDPRRSKPADRPLCNQKIADRGVVRQSSSGTAIDGRVQTLSKARDRFGRHCRRKQGGTVPREGEVGDLHRPHPGEIIFSGRTASSNSASVT